MMDVLIPVVKGIDELENTNVRELLKFASKTAVESAENTKNFAAKYGRAKNSSDKSIGTIDCGSVSMSLFFKSLYEAI